MLQFAYSFYWLYLIATVVFSFCHEIIHGYLLVCKGRVVKYILFSLYILIEAILFAPLIMIALASGVLLPAVIITLFFFGLVTAYAFISKKNFSFLSSYLFAGSVSLLLAIIIGVSFNIGMGIILPAFGIILACGYILYDTSNIINNYNEDQYMAASIRVISSVLLLFWYVITFLLKLLAIFGDN